MKQCRGIGVIFEAAGWESNAFLRYADTDAVDPNVLDPAALLSKAMMDSDQED